MNEPKPKFPFTPAKLRARHDGWTSNANMPSSSHWPRRESSEACRRVGMSRTSADNLRRRPCGVHFRRAWQVALDYSVHLVEADAHRRSRDGVARPIFYKGEQVGEWRHYDERLTMFLLRSYRPDRYGKARERLPAPECDEFGEEYPLEDPGIVLEGGLTQIEFCARDVPVEEGDDDEPYAL